MLINPNLPIISSGNKTTVQYLLNNYVPTVEAKDIVRISLSYDI